MPPVPGTQISPYAAGAQAAHADAPAMVSEFRAANQGCAPPWAASCDPIIPLKAAARIAGLHPQTLKNEAMRKDDDGKPRLVLIRVSERRIGVRQSEWNRYLSARVWAAA
jgi:hypothetical protein